MFEVMNAADFVSLNVATSSGFFVLIALVQVLIYPSFLKVGAADLAAYLDCHRRGISWIVGPLFLLDGVVGLSLVLLKVNGAVWNGALYALPFLATFFIFVPLHGKMERFPSKELCSKLIAYNWVRVILWGAKLVFALVGVSQS